ncbi:ankyrin repeat domain-containing protein [Planctomycetota bacterium]|nr:ankyrin repeat domain-containing protein [Planctomycetota bacterium]
MNVDWFLYDITTHISHSVFDLRELINTEPLMLSYISGSKQHTFIKNILIVFTLSLLLVCSHVISAQAVSDQSTTKVADQSSATKYKVTYQSDQPSVEIPLKTGSYLLFTDAIRINGHRVGYFLIDTGSNVSVVDERIAKVFRLPLSDRISSINNQSINKCAFVNIELGPMKIDNADLSLLDLKSFQQFTKPLAGIIGTDLLDQIPFTIDIRHATLTLHDPKHLVPNPKAKVFELLDHEPIPSDNNHLHIRPIIQGKVNGIQANCLLDTGNNTALFISSKVAAKKPEYIGLPSHMLRSPTTFGDELAFRHQYKIEALELFGKEIPCTFNTVTSITPEQASKLEDITDRACNIGSLILRDYRLTFDLANHQLYVMPTKLPAIHEDDIHEKNFIDCTPLETAVRFADVDVLKQLIEIGAPLDGLYEGESNLLHTAVISGKFEIFKLLLDAENGPDVNAARSDRATPFMLAVALNESEMARLLIERGADIHATDKTGRNVINACQDPINIPMAKLLLEAGANPNPPDADMPPIFGAMAKGSEEMVNVLLTNGAKIDQTTKEKSTSLHYAAIGGNTKLIQLALDHLPSGAVNQPRTDEWITPLMIASHNGRTDAVVMLLNAGADPLTRTGKMNPAMGSLASIHYASIEGHYDVIKTLLDAGVPVDQATTKNLTPLIFAASKGHVRVVKMLLDYGADVNKRNDYDESAIRYAIYKNQPSIIPHLLNAGASVTDPDVHGARLLDVATAQNMSTCARMLINGGANPYEKGSHGLSAIDIAEKYKHTQLADMLRQLSQKNEVEE